MTWDRTRRIFLITLLVGMSACSTVTTDVQGARPAPEAQAVQPGETQAHEVAGLGRLNFPTSTRSLAAQAAFDEGMLALHLFEYDRAERAFLRAQQLDPDFAMAYWGEAMTYTHPVWNQQDMARGRAALAKLGADAAQRAAKAPSEREKHYLTAVEILYGDGSKPERDQRYLQAMRALAEASPADDELQLFYSLALLGVTQGERDVGNFLHAAQIAEAVYRRNPKHPGAAHYWIHGMDDPEHAAGALEAAHALSKIAPGAGHAQHMTSHIFVALGLWDAVVESNLSADLLTQELAREAGHPPYGCGHYNEWLQYAYYQQGRDREATDVLRQCHANAKALLAWSLAHPDKPVFSMRTPAALKDRLDSSLVRMRGVAVVESPRNRTWAASLPLGDVDAAGKDGWAIFAPAIEHAWRGDLTQASQGLAKLQTLLARPDPPDSEPAVRAYVEVMQHMLAAVNDQKSGKRDAALVHAAQAAARYDRIPFDFGPPVPFKPPHELRGELLLLAKQPAEALAEFDGALKAAPQRARSLLGRARALRALGDGRSRQAYADLLALWKQADGDLPELAEVRAEAR